MDKNKILISWYAKENDFENGRVNLFGPTISFHKYFYALNKYKKHVILSSKLSDDTQLDLLLNQLALKFPEHTIEERYMNISDPIDMKSIYSKISKLLIDYKDFDIDVFISPGTSAMFASWILAHQSLKLTSRLFQTKRLEHSNDKSQPEIVELKLDISNIPFGLNVATAQHDFTSSEKIIVTKSLEDVYNLASKISLTDDATVLIIGETGTGKENLARYIHDKSSRAKKPYKAINCASFGDSLLESRLFGYKKGAFTGAEKDTIGFFEAANGGTIFLDEIGSISPYMQQVLLRVIQEKEISKIGDTKTEKVDVRVICATNENLWEFCKSGKFRYDLYYRLSVAELSIPTLFERGRKELKEYLYHFVETKKNDFKKTTLKFSEEAEQCILNYSWPGNLRELENTIERLYIYCDKNVELKDLPDRLKAPELAVSLKWDTVEKDHLLKILKKNKGNIERTGDDIGYSRNTIIDRFSKYKIDPKDYK